MRLTLAFFVFLALYSMEALASPCLGDEELAQVKKAEAAYMLGRIPPAFKHAYDDQQINISIIAESSTDNGSCGATLNINLPIEDLKEAHEILEKDPAKQILLFSQGYSLPDQPQQSASFKLDSQTLEIAHQDMLQTHALGRLHASVEMMYALITQSRAAKSEKEEDIKPWSASFMHYMTEACVDRSPTPPPQETCLCKVHELSKHYGERMMENILYVQSNPFAEATGATAGFAQIEAEINRKCK